MEGKFLKYEKRGSAGILIFNNPAALNALNTETLKELDQFLEKIPREEEIRALILTGEGKAFIAGADIREMLGMDPPGAAEFSRKGQEVLQKIEDFPIPVLAGVNGFALGGGLEVVLACDFAWGSEDARLGFPETTLGVFPGFSGNRRLTERVGKARAKELIFTGRIITPAEAASLGILNRVCPADELLNSLVTLAEELSKTSPHAVSRVKGMLNLCPDLTSREADMLETRGFSDLFDHPDQKEGMKAFLEKRKAVWKTLKGETKC